MKTDHSCVRQRTDSLLCYPFLFYLKLQPGSLSNLCENRSWSEGWTLSMISVYHIHGPRINTQSLRVHDCFCIRYILLF